MNARFAGIGIDKLNRAVLFLVREQEDARDAAAITARAEELLPGARRIVTATLDGMEVWQLHRPFDEVEWRGTAVPASGIDLRRWLMDHLIDWRHGGADAGGEPSPATLDAWWASETPRKRRVRPA